MISVSGESVEGQGPTMVVGAALLHQGRLLAARRVVPAATAGGWELPGGKVEPGETPEAAVVREVGEELGCEVAVTRLLDGATEIGPGSVLRVALATLRSGEPVPHEHDAVRWLGPEELDEVRWLEADRPFLPVLRALLLDGHTVDGADL